MKVVSAAMRRHIKAQYPDPGVDPASATPDFSALAPELVVAHQPLGSAAERFRALRIQLMESMSRHEKPKKALAVLSSHRGDGKSMVAANLAVSFSQSGLRTLLVDANMRQPRMHTLFGIDRPGGLDCLLRGRQDDAFSNVDGLPQLLLLPAGSLQPSSPGLLERPAFTLLMQDWIDSFDQVIVDTSAAEDDADARVLASKCGAALIVARPGSTLLAPLQKLVKSLRSGPVVLHGVVLNDG